MSGPTETDSKQKATLPSYLKPYVKEEYLPRALELSQQPFNPYTGERLAPFTPMQEQAFQLAGEIGGEMNPYMQAAGNTFMQMQSPDYLTGNEDVSRLVGTAQSDIVDKFNTEVMPNSVYEFARLGPGNISNTGLAFRDAQDRYGLARALGDVESQIRVPMYEAAANRQLQSLPFATQLAQDPNRRLAMLLSTGAVQQAQAQQGLDIPYQQFQQEQQWPYQMLDVLGQAIPIATGGGRYGQQPASAMQPGADPWMLGIGGALTAASIIGAPWSGGATLSGLPAGLGTIYQGSGYAGSTQGTAMGGLY